MAVLAHGVVCAGDLGDGVAVLDLLGDDPGVGVDHAVLGGDLPAGVLHSDGVVLGEGGSGLSGVSSELGAGLCLSLSPVDVVCVGVDVDVDVDVFADLRILVLDGLACLGGVALLEGGGADLCYVDLPVHTKVPVGLPKALIRSLSNCDSQDDQGHVDASDGVLGVVLVVITRVSMIILENDQFAGELF